MEFNDLLRSHGIDPASVAVLRHSFSDTNKNRTLLWVANERPDLFDAFQSVQDKTVEGAMERLNGRGYVAAFVGDGAGRALFVGLFCIVSSVPMRPDEIFTLPGYEEIHEIGLMTRDEYSNEFHRKFEMRSHPEFASWKGRLVVKWPPPERSWYRKAATNSMTVLALHETSKMDPPVPPWTEISLSWEQLNTLPQSWKNALMHWRGIYFIHDSNGGAGYVGSAYGDQNLLGRWLNYAASGHGGNKRLRNRDPKNFRFSILQLLSPVDDLPSVVHVETSWKMRLCTRGEHGLNEN